MPVSSLPSVLVKIPWVRMAGAIAPFASVVVYAAPLPTIHQVTQDRDSGSLPLLPYSCTLSSAFVWLTYGIVLREPKIWSNNVIGLFLGLYYFVQFTRFAPKQSPALPGSIGQHVQGCLAVAIGTALVALTMPSSATGQIAVVLCVAMFASPLAALKTVLHTKSASAIPLPFTLATVSSSFLWSIVGFDMENANILLPNLLGLAAGLTQLFLKLLYRSGSAELKRAM